MTAVIFLISQCELFLRDVIVNLIPVISPGFHRIIGEIIKIILIRLRQ